MFKFPAKLCVAAAILFCSSVTQQQAAMAQAPNGTAKPALPDASTIVILLRTTLLTLNDAVRTGNFTVLRDAAAPSFRDANTAGRLAQIFTSLTNSRIDLAPIAVSTPQLAEAPSIDPKNGMLNIKGYFAIPGARVDFNLLFAATSDGWRVFGIAVQPAPVQAAFGIDPAPQASSAPAPNAARSPAPKPAEDKKPK